MISGMYNNIFIFSILIVSCNCASSKQLKNNAQLCQDMSRLQYFCDPPIIDPSTQQPVSCNPDNSVTYNCKLAAGLTCEGLRNDTTGNYFYKRVENACDYDAHLSHSTALLLSIFLGLLGIDRIYLGYYAIGFVKMFSLGGLFILWLADVVLIALQIVLPADGSSYIINYYGPRVSALRFDQNTSFSIYTCHECVL